MPKQKVTYVCQACGYSSPGWMGKCPECNSWNSLIEELVPASKNKTTANRRVESDNKALSLSAISIQETSRTSTGFKEFDRVLGGGMVPGAVMLLGGSPGMGKSTLMMQVCGALVRNGKKILYISGEESATQIKMRADRLGVSHDNFLLLCETDVDRIISSIQTVKADIVVVDSIQTVFSSRFETLPGNIGQVRYCGYVLTTLAKEEQIPLFLIGHVTKEGTLAGPRVLEHLVDCLLLFEGDRQQLFRLLRSAKNRFGSTYEIGIFEMTDKGMREIENPSMHLTANRKHAASGSCITVSLEGSRPILLEVQALVSQTNYGVPQRTATGFDHRRLSMLIAVLEKRVGYLFGNQDVFVNTAGGLKLNEPGCDLGMAMALTSSLQDQALPSDLAVFGEIGLSGEIRAVSHMEQRIGEAIRLGFHTLILPETGLKGIQKTKICKFVAVNRIQEAVDVLSKMN